MRSYLITAKLMRPSNMKRFPTPGLDHSKMEDIQISEADAKLALVIVGSLNYVRRYSFKGWTSLN
jgi:hypothetical protein